jgi:predicted transcriptional regulator
MSNNEKLHKVGFEADETLYNDLQVARKAGCMYNGKRFSNRLAYEIGVKVLLGINEKEEEEALKRKLEDVRIKKTLLDNQENLILASLKQHQEKKQKEIEAYAQVEQDVQKLAERIIKDWVSIRILKKIENIGFIVNMFPDRLTKSKVEKVFSEGGLEAPTIEEALEIASNLLGAEKNV